MPFHLIFNSCYILLCFKIYEVPRCPLRSTPRVIYGYASKVVDLIFNAQPHFFSRILCCTIRFLVFSPLSKPNSNLLRLPLFPFSIFEWVMITSILYVIVTSLIYLITFYCVSNFCVVENSYVVSLRQGISIHRSWR